MVGNMKENELLKKYKKIAPETVQPLEFFLHAFEEVLNSLHAAEAADKKADLSVFYNESTKACESFATISNTFLDLYYKADEQTQISLKNIQDMFISTRIVIIKILGESDPKSFEKAICAVEALKTIWINAEEVS